MTTPRALLSLAVALAAAPASAAAADLIALDGDPAVDLSGAVAYGTVFIDTDLRLLADSSIDADTIYLGPHAGIQACFVPPSNVNGCTDGRSLALRARRTLIVTNSITLRGAASTARGGTLVLGGSDVSVGDIDTRSVGGAASGPVTVSATGKVVGGSIYAPGASVAITAASGIEIGGDITAAPDGGSASAAPDRAPDSGAITLTSGGGDVDVHGALRAYGANGTATLRGGNGGAITIAGGDVRVFGLDSTGGDAASADAGLTAPVAVTARGGFLVPAGGLYAHGGRSTGASSTDAATVTVRAGGPVSINQLYVNGQNSPVRGGNGGRADIQAASIKIGYLPAFGGGTTGAGSLATGGNGGSLALAASGNILISSIDVQGADSAGSGAGGAGGSADVQAGGSVHLLGGASVYGGQGAGAGGATGPLTVRAGGDVSIDNGINAAGRGSSSGPSSDGGAVTITAGGDVRLPSVSIHGGTSPGRGAHAGALRVQGAAITVGNLWAYGTGATNGGGNGALVEVTGSGPVVLGSIHTGGGDAQVAGFAGGTAGTVRIRGLDIATGWISARGGGSGLAGANGAPVWLSADRDLSVAGDIVTNGSSGDDPSFRGGDGADIYLRANAGTLRLAGTAQTAGGFGGGNATAAAAGAGGNAGRITVVAAVVDAVGGFQAPGGTGGYSGGGGARGAGGNGGAVTVYSDSPVLDGTRFVETAAGDGNPRGLDAIATQHSSPTGLTIDADGRLSFTSRSPGASYRILRAAGGPPEAVATVSETTGVTPPAPPVCTKVTYTVAAVAAPVDWVSVPSNPVTFIRQPSATQTCTQAPKLKATARQVSLRTLARRRFVLKVPVRVLGIGSLTVSMPGRAPRVRVSREVTRPGVVTIPITLPTRARRAGTFRITVVARAPIGSASRRLIVPLEIVP